MFDALGLEPSELFGQVVGYEGLAGCDSVDAAYLLNGLFQKLLGAVSPESRQYVERSRYDVCLCKVRDRLQFSQDRIEAASDLQESECQRAIVVSSVGAVDNALEGYRCLSVCDTWDAPDLSIVVKAFVGSLVRSLITRSNLPVTGVADSTVGIRWIWEMMCARSPLHLANMYPV